MRADGLCIICGTEDIEFVERYSAAGGHAVCSQCAAKINDAFEYVHGGRNWDGQGNRVKDRPSVNDTLRWAVFKRDGYKCKHCGKESHLRVDHIIPYSANGETTFENLQTLCHNCNSKKGTRL